MLNVRIWPRLSCSSCYQNAYREIIIWKNLKHPNILPLLGVDKSISQLRTISARMEYGSLMEYLAVFPEAPRSKLVRYLFNKVDLCSRLPSCSMFPEA